MLKQAPSRARVLFGIRVSVAIKAVLYVGLLSTVYVVCASGLETAHITSSADGTKQPSRFWIPEDVTEPVPLLVGLHTWSGDYTQDNYGYPRECRTRGWAFIHPDFRGPNTRPEACGSDLALADIRDAVAWMCDRTAIDPNRIYVVGVSGGGHMALLCAAQFPTLWAAVSAWVPPADLAAWHAETSAKRQVYAEHLAAVCGGAPGDSVEVDLEYRRRSPVHRLSEAKDVRIEIAAGIRDGHDGSVPISHTLESFNVLARVNGLANRVIPGEIIDEMVRTARIPASLGEPPQDTTYVRPVLFRREAGPVRVTIFQGSHEIQTAAAIDWLARHRRQASSAGVQEATQNYE